MEFEDIVVKESPGLCRCCLSEGCYKDLGTEYNWMSETEVYADMLLECFDISISQHNDGPNGPNRLICEVCITRLRDACNFKKQVLDSEKKFVDMVGRGEFKHKVLIYQPPMKFEGNVEEMPADEAEVEYLEDVDFGDDDLLKPDDTTETLTEDITVSALPVKGKRGRPRKNALVKNEKKAKIPKLEEKPRTSKSATKGEESHEEDYEHYEEEYLEDLDDSEFTRIEDKVETEIDSDEPDENSDDIMSKERKIMAENVTGVIMRSTVMPFRWLRTSYRCFYCYDMFQEPIDLKKHQENHSSDEIKEIMKNYWEPTVFVDVSDISCRLCTDPIKELYQLINHLINKHKMPFHSQFGVQMIPFKLKKISVGCVTCQNSYRTFGQLLMHTNKECRGCYKYTCDVCGCNFRNSSTLYEHKSTKHENRQPICKICRMNVGTPYRMRTHMQKYHNQKVHCYKCSESFETHYKRAQHMMIVHNTRRETKCTYCPRSFVFPSSMIKHVREMHLREKNVVCTICGWQGFSEHRLQKHMIKHSSLKNYMCKLCNKALKTKKTMKQHYKLIHDCDVNLDEIDVAEKNSDEN